MEGSEGQGECRPEEGVSEGRRDENRTAPQQAGEFQISADQSAGEAVLPFVGHIADHVPGMSITVERMLTLDEDLHLADHTFVHAPGVKPVSACLPVVPLTMAMEIMAETAACLDREGWYHTGDVGYVDADGYFFIVDRTKELIKYKGLQVAPAELEALLVTHPAVLDAAVVRRADEEAGEVPKAFVVLKADEASRATKAEAIMGWVAERVAPHKRIRQMEFIDQIPKSASGKILRRMLMDKDKTR